MYSWLGHFCFKNCISSNKKNVKKNRPTALKLCSFVVPKIIWDIDYNYVVIIILTCLVMESCVFNSARKYAFLHYKIPIGAF